MPTDKKKQQQWLCFIVIISPSEPPGLRVLKEKVLKVKICAASFADCACGSIINALKVTFPAGYRHWYTSGMRPAETARPQERKAFEINRPTLRKQISLNRLKGLVFLKH